ncbi:unnamed protein product [Notodromas monacha]|uniref:Uncharacterized protein n=1 Tax=Notodromas monacha TaxID=399045 RepID=A0A7R9BJ11_9CRUS|nr:unnamed protein product [Notodromas monacha]CAG0915522.1 unnamed protein product [Notodromas monacha]
MSAERNKNKKTPAKKTSNPAAAEPKTQEKPNKKTSSSKKQQPPKEKVVSTYYSKQKKGVAAAAEKDGGKTTTSSLLLDDADNNTNSSSNNSNSRQLRRCRLPAETDLIPPAAYHMSDPSTPEFDAIISTLRRAVVAVDTHPWPSTSNKNPSSSSSSSATTRVFTKNNAKTSVTASSSVLPMMMMNSSSSRFRKAKSAVEFDSSALLSHPYSDASLMVLPSATHLRLPMTPPDAATMASTSAASAIAMAPHQRSLSLPKSFLSDRYGLHGIRAALPSTLAGDEAIFRGLGLARKGQVKDVVGDSKQKFSKRKNFVSVKIRTCAVIGFAVVNERTASDIRQADNGNSDKHFR